MHIPDGFLSAPVALASAALAMGTVGVACAGARRTQGPAAIARIGVTSAFVFAAQMINFPVWGGTSGHLVGGTLAAVLLGPSAAVVAMCAVLVLQCLVFGDGGLLALGANVLNMGVIHPLVGYALYRGIVGVAGRGPGPSAARVLTGLAFGSWVATVVASAACAGELALSRTAEPALVLPAMVSVHVAIGLGEALISSLVLVTVMRLRPALLAPATRAAQSTVLSSLLGLGPSLALALFVSPFACAWPDGLERAVHRLGIEPSHARIALHAPLRGYTLPGFPPSALTGPVLAAAGTLLVFGFSAAIGYGLASRRPS
jgi:cobalt/nickel transport system permease protein